MKKGTEDKNDVISYLGKNNLHLKLCISENNIKVLDECHIEIYLGFLWNSPLSSNSI